jgi:hypothetical protein
MFQVAFKVAETCLQEHFHQLYHCWQTCVTADLYTQHVLNSAMTGKQTRAKLHELSDCTIYIPNKMVTFNLIKIYHLL